MRYNINIFLICNYLFIYLNLFHVLYTYSGIIPEIFYSVKYPVLPASIDERGGHKLSFCAERYVEINIGLALIFL